jgi:PAS domain S-box-containing protein
MDMNLDELIDYHSENAVICLSEEYLVLSLNKFAEKVFRISRQDVIQRNFFALCHIDNIQLPFNPTDLIQQSKNPKFSLGSIVLEYSEKILVEWKIVHCHSSDFEKPFFLLIIRSIPLGQEKNKISNLLYLKDIVENLPEYIYWKDLDFIYQGCNKQVAKYLGLNNPNEIVGKSDYDFGWDVERIKKLHKADKKVIEKKVNVIFEDTISKSKGLTRIMLTSKSPLFDKDGNILGILGVSTDITELKRTRQKLIITKNKLAAMTLLSSTIAHELRTPLSSLNLGVTGMDSMLPDLIATYKIAKNKKLDIPKIDNLKFSVLNDILSDMKYEIRAAFTFIDMLLTKLNPSVSAKNNEFFFMNQCIRYVLEKYPFEESQRGLISAHLSDDFGVQGSLVLVAHVFFNLFKNSLYYIAACGKGEIFITLEKGQLYNKVFFKDTGAGISADILPRIFTQFFSKTYHGTGIGLAFCKKVMKALNGDIVCESVAQEYTLFTLSFPNTLKSMIAVNT